MNSNGNTIDREGRLITCEHGGRRVTRTELDGSITIIADRYNGKKLNSPNDVTVASDGSIWFTDPVYGIGGRAARAGKAQRLPRRSEQPPRRVDRYGYEEVRRMSLSGTEEKID
jgi:sugar lactone lactonase YvrE